MMGALERLMGALGVTPEQMAQAGQKLEGRLVRIEQGQQAISQALQSIRRDQVTLNANLAKVFAHQKAIGIFLTGGADIGPESAKRHDTAPAPIGDATQPEDGESHEHSTSAAE